MHIKLAPTSPYKGMDEFDYDTVFEAHTVVGTLLSVTGKQLLAAGGKHFLSYCTYYFDSYERVEVVSE